MQSDDWRDSDLFSEQEKAVIAWSEAITRHTAKEDEAAFQAMRKHFNDQDLVTLTIFAGLWNCSNRIAEALHLLVEPPGGRIGFQKEDLRVSKGETS